MITQSNAAFWAVLVTLSMTYGALLAQPRITPGTGLERIPGLEEVPGRIREQVEQAGSRVRIVRFEKLVEDCEYTNSYEAHFEYEIHRPASAPAIDSIVVNMLLSDCVERSGFCEPAPPDDEIMVRPIFRWEPDDPGGAPVTIVGSVPGHPKMPAYAYVLAVSDEEGAWVGSRRVIYRMRTRVPDLAFLPVREQRDERGPYFTLLKGEWPYSTLPFAIDNLRMTRGRLEGADIPLQHRIVDENKNVRVYINSEACGVFRNEDVGFPAFDYEVRPTIGRCEGDTEMRSARRNYLDIREADAVQSFCDLYFPISEPPPRDPPPPDPEEPPPPPPDPEGQWYETACNCDNSFSTFSGLAYSCNCRLPSLGPPLACNLLASHLQTTSPGPFGSTWSCSPNATAPYPGNTSPCACRSTAISVTPP